MVFFASVKKKLGVKRLVSELWPKNVKFGQFLPFHWHSHQVGPPRRRRSSLKV